MNTIGSQPPLQLTESEVQARVDAGIAWLDAKHPGWADKIDTTRMNMGYAGSCVLSQVMGTKAWRDTYVTAGLSLADCKTLGFDAYGGGHTEFSVLERLWKREIGTRQFLGISAAQEEVEQRQDAKPVQIIATENEIAAGFKDGATIHTLSINGIVHRGTWPAIQAMLADIRPCDINLTTHTEAPEFD